MKTLYLVRGVPGSGKSTLAESICENVFAADDYFLDSDGNYCYTPKLIHSAHMWCLDQTAKAMKAGKDVAVANTFTREWEMQKYYDLAESFGYRVFSLITENRHGGYNVHGVPGEKVCKMRERFEVQL